MFQTLLENLLRRLLGDYVEKIESNNIQMNVYSGIIEMKDLNFKQDIFRKFNIPIQLEMGRIKSISVNVPWNLLSTQQVYFEVDGVMLLICPLKQTEQESFVEQQNQFQILEKKLLQYCKQIYLDLLKNHQNSNQNSQEQEGYFANLTKKIVDNIKICVKNIHIRYEDKYNFGKPFSAGITLKQLDAQTTNEQWNLEFIDRTLPENKMKALLKKINLSNLGFYCNPSDSIEQMISGIPIDENNKNDKFNKFYEMFSQKDENISIINKEWYISKPISICTQLKKQSELSVQEMKLCNNGEPLYQIYIQINQIDVTILKSQFKSIFVAVDLMKDFQRFIDNYLNKRVILLQKFYQQKDDYENLRSVFGECLLKKIKIFWFQEQKMTSAQLEEIVKQSLIDEEKHLVYTSLVNYENKLKLFKWAKSIIHQNIQELKEILEVQQKEKENQEIENPGIVGYIASSVNWISQGLYSQEQKLEIKNEDNQAQEQPQAKNEDQISQKEVLDETVEDEFKDAIDYDYQDAIQDIEQFLIVNSKNIEANSLDKQDYQNNINEQIQTDENENIDNQDDFHLLSKSEIKNAIQNCLQTEETDQNDIQQGPFFSGSFQIDLIQISLIDDCSQFYKYNKKKQKEMLVLQSNVDNTITLQNVEIQIQDKEIKSDQETVEQNNEIIDQQTQTQEQVEVEQIQETFIDDQIIIYLKNLTLDYNHFDSKVSSNTDQIKIQSSCNKLGLQLVQQNKNIDSQDFEKIDIIIQNNKLNDADIESDFLNLNMNFGNQNIKEQMLTKLESTDNFIDQEMIVQILPLKISYNKEFTTFLVKYLTIQDDTVADEEKIRAQEEYELLLQSVKQQNIFENHVHIRYIFKIQINFQSIFIILPIKDKIIGSEQECWIADIQNLFISNIDYLENDQTFQNDAQNKFIYLENIFKFDLKNANLQYCDNISFAEGDIDKKKKQILNNLDFQIVLKIKDDSLEEKENEANISLQYYIKDGKLWIDSVAYVHLINIYSSLKSDDYVIQNNQISNEIKQIISIFYNAKYCDCIKVKVNSDQHWHDYIAVISHDYIYFFELQQAESIKQIFNIIDTKLNEMSLNDNQKQDQFEQIVQYIIEKKLINLFRNIDYQERFSIKSNNQNQNQNEQNYISVMDISKNSGRSKENEINQNQILINEHIMKITNLKDQTLKLKFPNEQILSKWQSYIINYNYDETIKIDTQKIHTNKINRIFVINDIKIENIEIIIEGQNKLQLNSQNILAGENDIMNFCVNFPKQFINQQQSEIWKFKLIGNQINFVHIVREFDSEMKLDIYSLQLEEISHQDLHQNKNKIILQSKNFIQNDLQSSKIIQKSLQLTINFLEEQSIKFVDTLMNIEIILDEIEINWNPKSLIKFLRFVMFYMYPQEYIEPQILILQQTILIQIQKLIKQQLNNSPISQNQKQIIEMYIKQLNKIQILLERSNDCVQSQNDCQQSEQTETQIQQKDIEVGKENKMERQNEIIFVKKRQNCIDDQIKSFVLIANAKQLKVICYHPQNDSLPVMTLDLQTFQLNYTCFIDHQNLEGFSNQIQIIDNSGYPYTLDPMVNHQLSQIPKINIIQSNNNQKSVEHALTFCMQFFKNTLDFSCPLQHQDKFKNFDKIIQINLKNIKMNYIQEPIFRLLDYILTQFFCAITDIDPFDKIQKNIEKYKNPFFQNQDDNNQDNESQNKSRSNKQIQYEQLNDSFSSIGTHQQYSELFYSFIENNQESQDQQQLKKEIIKKKQIDYKQFDLQQYQLTTGLEITLNDSIILLQDRPSSKDFLEIQLDSLTLSNQIQSQKGKWKNYPDKESIINQMMIDLQKVSIVFGQQRFQVTQLFDMQIVYERVSHSDLLKESFLSPLIDFNEFDMKQIITIQSQSLKMSLNKNVYKYILRILDLNINYSDQLDSGFQFGNWDTEDYLFNLNIEKKSVELFINTFIAKRQIKFEVFEFALRILDNEFHQVCQRNDALLSEIILDIFKLNFIQFIDYKKDISITANNLFLVQENKEVQIYNKNNIFKNQQTNKNQRFNENFQKILIGPIINLNQNNKNIEQFVICNNKNINSSSNSFETIIRMDEDGNKIINMNLTKLKILLQYDILMILLQFFTDNFPEYTTEQIDKPSFFDPDPNNYPQFQLFVKIKHSVFVLQQIQNINKKSLIEFLKNNIEKIISKNIKIKENKNSFDKDFIQKLIQSIQNFNHQYNETIAIQGQFNYQYQKEQLNKQKLQIIENYYKIQQSKNFEERQQFQDIQLDSYIQSIKISNVKLFICDINDIENFANKIEKILRRKILQSSKISYSCSEKIQITRNKKCLEKILKYYNFQKSKIYNNKQTEVLMFQDKNFNKLLIQQFDIGVCDFELQQKDINTLKAIISKFIEMGKFYDDYQKAVEKNKTQIQNSQKQNNQIDTISNKSNNLKVEINSQIFSLEFKSINIVLIYEDIIDMHPIFLLSFKDFFIWSQQKGNIQEIFLENKPNQRQLFYSQYQYKYSISMKQFDPKNGVWQSFVNPFQINLNYNSNQNLLQFVITSILEINFNHILLSNFQKLLEKYREKELIQSQFEYILKNLKSIGISSHQIFKTRQQRFDYQINGPSTFHFNQIQQLKKNVNITYEDLDMKNVVVVKMQQILEEQIISPYRIVNQTDFILIIRRLDQQGKVFQYKTKNIMKHYIEQGHSFDFQIYSNKLYSAEIKNNSLQNDNINNQQNNFEQYQYQNQLIKVSFDERSYESNLNFEDFKENREIKKININEIQNQHHYLRAGKYSELIYYEISRMNYQKVLTLRTQYQIINQTQADYLVHLKINNISIVKQILPGESMPLPMRYDKGRIQFKIIDKKQTEYQFKRVTYEEEIQARNNNINDFKTQYFKDWTSMVSIQLIKYKLKNTHVYYFQNNKSKYTLLKQNVNQINQRHKTVDIILMTGLKIKNSLPLNFHITFMDSSNQKQIHYLQVDQEISLCCLSLNHTVIASLQVPGFTQKNDIVLYDQKQFNMQEQQIELQNHLGQKTIIYFIVDKMGVGSSIIFYAKNIIIDSIDSKIQFSYLENEQSKIPFNIKKELMHKIYIIPSGMNEIRVNLYNDIQSGQIVKLLDNDQNDVKECNIIQNNIKYYYVFKTNKYLVSKKFNLQAQISNFNPKYVFLNKTEWIFDVEQLFYKFNPLENEYQIYNEIYLLSLQKNQQKPFFSYKNEWTEKTFFRLKLKDSRNKQEIQKFEIDYINCSNPFKIQKSNFTLVLNPKEIKGVRLSAQKYIKVIIDSENKCSEGSTYIIFEKGNIQNQEFLIENKSKQMKCLLQEEFNEQKKIQLCFPDQQVVHEYSVLNENKVLKLSFLHYQEQDINQKLLFIDGQQQKQNDIIIQFNQIGYKNQLKIIQNNINSIEQEYTFLNIEIFANGFQKVLKISDNQDINQIFTIQKNNHIISKELKIKQLLISISNDQIEILSIYFHNFRFKIQEKENNKYIKTQIDYFQIDNMSESNPTFPILLKPRQFFYDKQNDKIFYNLPIQLNDNPKVFELLIKIQKHSNLTYIEQVKHYVHALDIKVQLCHIEKIMQFIQLLAAVSVKKQKFVHYIFQNNYNFSYLENKYEPSQEIEQDTYFYIFKYQFSDDLSLDYSSKNDGVSNQIRIKQQKNSIVYENEDVYITKCGKYESFKQQQQYIKIYQKTEFIQKFSLFKQYDNINIQNMDLQSNRHFLHEIKLVEDKFIFIQSYLSNPIDLYVSAINEKIQSNQENKNNTPEYIQQKINQLLIQQQKQANLYSFGDEDSENELNQGTVQILGVNGQDLAQKILYYSQFEDILFKINGISVKNLYGESNLIMQILISTHRDQINFNTLNIIGSSNLIGNPSQLMKKMATGVYDFLYKPYVGLKQKNFSKFKEGIIQGSTSLMQNSFKAPIQSFSKIGKSFSRGTLALSFDPKFVEQKQDDDNIIETKNFKEGLKKGISNARTSIQSGLVGLVDKPSEGLKQEGVIGLFKGSAKGAAGLLSKTISGGIDIIANSSEGLDNQMQIQDQFQSQRIREPINYNNSNNLTNLQQ